MLHFISQSSDTHKIKNFFEHRRLDDGKTFKNHIKIPKKIAVAKQAAAIPVFCLFKIQYPIYFILKDERTSMSSDEIVRYI